MYETDLTNYIPCHMSQKYLVNCDKGQVINKKNNRILCFNSKNHRYETVTLEKKTHYLHHVVYCSFNKCDMPSDKEIDHKDGNIFNNSISNLQLMTRKDNMRKSHRTRDHSHTKLNLRRCSAKAVTAIEVADENNTIEFDSIYQAQKLLGINSGQISMIIEGKNHCKTACSKANNKIYRFEYTDPSLNI